MRKFTIQRHEWLDEDEANMKDLLGTATFLSLKKFIENQVAGKNEDILNCDKDEEKTVRDSLQRIDELLSILDYFDGLKNESS